MVAKPRTFLKDLLDPEEKQVLESIYQAQRVPTDQLRRRPEIMHAIAAGFERTTSRRIEPGLLLRYMFNCRKNRDWPKLGPRAQKLQSLLSLLPPDQLLTLESIYLELRHPVDEYQFKPLLARELAERFFRATGVEETGEVLTAVMTARRKRGEWPAIFEGQQVQDTQVPFNDIAEVHRKHKQGA